MEICFGLKPGILTILMNIFEEFNWFKGRSNAFLLAELMADRVRVSAVRVNTASQEAVVLKSRSLLHDKLASAGWYGALSRLLSSFWFSSAQLYICIDSSCVVTAALSQTVTRASEQSEITEEEIEQVIAQTLWKAFDIARPDAARRLGVFDTELFLVDAQALRIRLDGCRVVSPLGFIAREIEITYRLSFAPKKVFDQLRTLWPMEQIIAIEEEGFSWVSALAQKYEREDFIFAAVLGEQTLLYMKEKSSIRYLDSVIWGQKQLATPLMREFAIDQGVALDILRQVGAGATSEKVSRRVMELILPEFLTLMRSLENRQVHGKPQAAYIASSFDTLASLVSLTTIKRIKSTIKPLAVDQNFIGENFGFRLQLKDQDVIFDPSLFALRLGSSAFFLHDSYIDKIVKRRARWLTRQDNS